MSNTKRKSVDLLGVNLPLEPFIDSAYIQSMLDKLNTNSEDNNRFMHNACVIAEYMDQTSLIITFKNQKAYFAGISAEDKLFNYKSHPDFKNATHVLTKLMITRKVPDVIINAIDGLY